MRRSVFGAALWRWLLALLGAGGLWAAFDLSRGQDLARSVVHGAIFAAMLFAVNGLVNGLLAAWRSRRQPR